MRAHRIVIVLGLVLTTYALSAILGCGEDEAARAPRADCIKRAGAPAEGVPIYTRSGGAGDLRAKVPGGTRVDILRSKNDWRLVRVPATTTAGWIEASALEKCAGRAAPGASPSGRRSKARRRATPSKAESAPEPRRRAEEEATPTKAAEAPAEEAAPTKTAEPPAEEAAPSERASEAEEPSE